MPPVLRPGWGRVAVPVDLPDDIRWVLDSWALDFGFDDRAEGLLYTPGGSADETLLSIETIVAVNTLPDGMVEVDGDQVADCRNELDLQVLAGSPECEEFAREAGVDLAAGDSCTCCGWCQCIILRDRCDYWMNAAGLERSGWIEDVAYDVEAVWALVKNGRGSPVIPTAMFEPVRG